MPYFAIWTDEKVPVATLQHLVTLVEKQGARAAVVPHIRSSMKDHFVGLDVLAKTDPILAPLLLSSRVPTVSKVQSGDLGEILASDFVLESRGYRVPIKRLRYKDDRNMAMRGDDILAFKVESNGKVVALKVEAKVRQYLSNSVCDDALGALKKYGGRPNPSSLGFIVSILRREGRDEEASMAELFLDASKPNSDIRHLIFVVAGKNLLSPLQKLANSLLPTTNCEILGLHISELKQFVPDIYSGL